MKAWFQLINNQKGMTLVEVLGAALILAISLTPFIAYLARNLNKVADVRNATVAHNLAREGAERVRLKRYSLGVFFVAVPGDGSFVDGYTLSAAQGLKVWVQNMGSSAINVSVNGGAASATIPADSVPGKLIDFSGSSLANVTSVSITGGTPGDKFEIIGVYPDVTQTVNSAGWTTQYVFADETDPMAVCVKVFKGSAVDYTAQLVAAAGHLR